MSPTYHQQRVKRSEAIWGWAGCVVPGCANPPILHHFIPRSKGGSNRPENLMPICEAHEKPIHLATQLRPVEKPAIRAKWAPFNKLARPLPDTEFRFGCVDCGFAYHERPAYCQACKEKGGRLSQITATSAQTRAYSPDHAQHGTGRPVAFWECAGCLSRSKVKEWCTHCGMRYHLVGNAKQRKVKTPLPTEQPGTLAACHAQFESYQRARSRKRGKQDHNYAYGKELATNMAAPFILRLREQIKQRP